MFMRDIGEDFSLMECFAIFYFLFRLGLKLIIIVGLLFWV